MYMFWVICCAGRSRPKLFLICNAYCLAISTVIFPYYYAITPTIILVLLV